MRGLSESWKCVCGVTVAHDLNQDEAVVVELDGVVHSCDDEGDDDF